MPGPGSTPAARNVHGQLITGKTALKHRGLKNREGLSQDDQRFAQRKAQEKIQQKLDAQALQQDAPKSDTPQEETK